MSARKPSRIGTVLHFTPSVGGGGAEAMLCNLVEAMHGGAWRTVVVAVKTGGPACRAARMREVADRFYDLEADALLRPALFRKLLAIIRAEQPAVVQTWMHHADFVGGLAARIAGTGQVVWGIHSRDIFRWPGDSGAKFALFKTALRLASRRVPQRIVSCSQTAIADHEAMGFPRAKMNFIANGICTRRFQPSAEAGARARESLGIPAAAPVIGFAGRFHPVKNLPLFFQAAALLQREQPDAHFVLSGGKAADLEPTARAAFEALPHRERVHFAAFNTAIESLYPAFTLFTLCSNSEALPMTLLEAMACGVPCVATDVGDCARVIADTGLVVPAGDAAALAASWKKMLGLDAATREALARQARERVVQHFSLTHAADEYQRLYRELIGQP